MWTLIALGIGVVIVAVAIACVVVVAEGYLKLILYERKKHTRRIDRWV